MVPLGSPTQQERLHVIAASLHLAYSEDALTASDAFAVQIRRLNRLDYGQEKKALPDVRQMCSGIKPSHEVEFIVVCPHCGQMFDCRDLPQLDHHSNTNHNPKLH